MTTSWTLPHYLYRAYNAAGELIYVGTTANPSVRIGQHAASKVWWSEVAKVDVDQHPDRGSAAVHERALIEEFAPRHNTSMHPVNRPTSRARASATAERYVVDVTTEDGVWLGQARDLREAHSYGPNLLALRKNMTEAILLILDEADAKVHLDFEFSGVPDIVLEAAQLGRDREDIELRTAELAERSAALIPSMLNAGYRVRDVSDLLGLTPGRVSQITSTQLAEAVGT